MKKLTTLFIFSILTTFLFGQRTHFTLKGLTNNIPDDTKVYLMDGKTNVNVDSTILRDNEFFFEGNATPYKEYWLTAQFGDQFEYKLLYVENVDMLFDARQSNFFNAKVTGSTLQAQSDELHAAIREWQDKGMAANDLIPQYLGKDEPKVDSLRKVRAHYFQKSDEVAYQFVKSHPDYLVSLRQLTYIKNKLPKAKTQAVFNAMPLAFQQSELGQSIQTYLEQSVNLVIGDKAPDFQLPNLADENVALSDFAGKYVLLEFGASGCGPCRMENPNLLSAYQTYRKNGFEIMSVWLDKNKANWQNTVAKDQMIWTTVSDLKGNNGPVPTIYNMTFMPTNYLLNPEGVVIAQDLRGEALQQELAKLFGGKKG